MKLKNFVGPTYTSQSPNADAERLVNWYPEAIESDGGKARVVFYPCPGIEQAATVGTGGAVRAMFAQDGRAFAVIGDRLYELFADRPPTERGNLKNDGRPATISSSGQDFAQQLFIVSGLNGYIFDLKANSLTPITDEGFPNGRALMGLYTDGYFIVLVDHTGDDTRQGAFQLSALHNGLEWDTNDTGRKIDTSDRLVAITVVRRELWLLGEQTAEVWFNNGGQQTFPFSPFPGKVMNIGCESPFSVTVVDSDQILFVGARNGCGMVYQVSDSPQRVSTHYVERMLQSYPLLDDAVAYSYQDQGHVFYVLTFPTGNATWVYDVFAGLWHERGVWNKETGEFDRLRAEHHAFAFNTHLVGDGMVPTIYRQAVTIPTQDGAPMVRVRAAPHVADEMKWFFYQTAQLDLETGLAFPAMAPVVAGGGGPERLVTPGQPFVMSGVDPQIMLRWSDDGGHVWSPYIPATAGRMGQYRMRAQWQRLGRSRDRVFEVSVSDRIPWRLLDFYLTLLPGTS
jgi:hypothetical protein